MNHFSHRIKEIYRKLIVMFAAVLVSTSAVVLVSVSVADSSAATNFPFPGTLLLREGKVTAQFNTVPLEKVMAEMSRVSGVQVVWLDDSLRVRLVSVRFTDLSLLRALDHLLSETNFLLVYSGEQQTPRLSHIWIAAPRQRTESLQTNFLPTPFLTGTTFTGNEPTEALIQTALYAPDPAARARMVKQLGLRDQNDERVRLILSLMAYEDGDPTVRNVAAEMFYSLGNQEAEETPETVEEEDADELPDE